MYKLLTRFSLSQKFMILGFIAFVLVSALTYLLVSAANKDIDLVHQEIKGSVSIVPVMRMLQTVQQHRGLSSLVLSGRNEVIPSWDAKRKEVDQAVEAIDTVIKRFPELNLASNWHTVQGQWQQLKTDVAVLSPQESFYRHTALIESITRFINLIADNSNITYDPTVESYEIGLIVSANMPMITEFMGRLRAWGGVLLGQKKASGDERASIDIYTGLLQYEFVKLNLALDKIYAVNPELKSVLKASRQEMESKVKEALKLINEQIVNSKKLDYPSLQYVNTLTRAIDAQFTFSRVVNEQLEISLNAQENRLETKKYTLLIIVVSLFALCVAVAMVVVRGILIQVRSVTRAIERITYGENVEHVTISHGSDEFVQIARSFDDMAAALQARESELSQFKNTLDQTLECVFMFDPQSLLFTYVNKGAMQQVGYSETELMQMTAVNIKPLVTLEQLQQIIQPLIEGVLPSVNFQTLHRHKDGHDIPVEVFLQLVRLEGQPPRFVAMVSDISERKESEAKLLNAMNEAEAANAAKSAFLANMSHEIRTPLNGVLGLTDLVLKTNLDEKQRDYLEKAKTSSKALLYVINDILDYSKIEAGKLNLEHRTFGLDSVMCTISDLFEYQVVTKGLSLNITCNNKLVLIGDALRLTQILTNIVGNAIKFTKKGSIDIGIEHIHEDEYYKKIKFSVKDSGIGMSKAQQENLFKEFTQADNSTTREYGGTGLGLSISKRLVDMMSGEIWTESIEGEGTTFIFTATFGKVEDETVATSTIKPEILKSNSDLIRGAHILLAEDNDTNQIVAAGILEDLGLVIDIANNGREAVKLIKAGKKYDLILMDLQMPIMDGFEATKQIQQIDKDIPIVALSAAVMQEDIIRTSEAKMSAHLAKPIDRDALIEILLKFIKPKKSNEYP